MLSKDKENETSRGAVSPPTHIMSVDVEDYFMVEAFASSVSQDSWKSRPSRVVMSTRRILDLFDKYNVKGIFFFVGWVAKQFPELVREVYSRGHELVCHSYWHRTVYSLTPDEFREDTRAAVRAIEDAAGVKVFGYRAPSWSNTKDCLWALDVLAEEGFTYDSSIYPIHRDLYGVPGAERFPYKLNCQNGNKRNTRGNSSSAWPKSSCSLRRLLAHFAAHLHHWAFRKFEMQYHERMIVYLHPWELDPEQPRISAGLKSRFRHYTNLRSMENRLESLLARYAFGSFNRLFAEGSADYCGAVLTPREVLYS